MLAFLAVGFILASADGEQPLPSDDVAHGSSVLATAKGRAVFGLALSGIALLGGGVGLRLSAGAVYDRIDIGYPAFNSYDELTATRRSGELQQQLALGLLLGGAAVLVVALVLAALP